jgi:exodeoxyribonuclease VII large subunit
VGEGSIKKAAALLEAKLAAEGLFDPARKRELPYPPVSIGLITSAESAAYRDFIKVLAARWGGLQITLIDVQVQGEAAPMQLIAAIEQFNQLADPPDVLIMTRGGGSAEDLQAFSNEQVTRAVAGSRIPTLVAIGHEIDLSLAELAADQRASTPSNAAELLVPDRRALLAGLAAERGHMAHITSRLITITKERLERERQTLQHAALRTTAHARQHLALRHQLLSAFDPSAALQRGFAIVRAGQQLVRSGRQLKPGDSVAIKLSDAHVTADVRNVTMEKE